MRPLSRNRMDCDRNEGRFAESVSKGCCGPLVARGENHCQKFNSCVVPKLAGGCMEMAQFEWVELLFRAFHEIGITVEFASTPRRRVRRTNL